MMRHVAISILILAAAPAVAQDAVGPAPRLRAEIIASGDLVRIGDLVEHAGFLAKTPVFRAPELGQTGTVQAQRVIDALASHGLTGVATDGVSAVQVRRASREITPRAVEEEIAAAVANRTGLSARNIAVKFDRAARTIHAEPSATGPLEVTQLFYDARSRRFDATLHLPGSRSLRREQLHFAGTATETQEVAILMRDVAKGEVLRDDMVEIQRLPKAGLASDAVESAEKAAGMAARRPIGAGEVLRSADLAKPELVRRNELVVLVYEVPGLAVTTRGKALESGIEGDVVNVTNIQSKRTVQGLVVGPNRVSVTADISRLAQITTGSISRSGARRPE